MISVHLSSVRLVFLPDIAWAEGQWDLDGANHALLQKALGLAPCTGLQRIVFDFSRVPAMTRAEGAALTEKLVRWFSKLDARGVLAVELPTAFCERMAPGVRGAWAACAPTPEHD